MKILALQGSPRPAGNTQAVLEAVLDAARRAGAEAEIVQLARLEGLRGCMECFQCQEEVDDLGCVVKDDMRTVLERALQADLIVWATPVFCWSPAWPLKMAMDRFFCTFKFSPDGKDVKSLMQGQKMAAVITAGGGEDDGADLVVETCRRMAHYSQADWRGAFVAHDVKTPDGIRADADLIERARKFGQALAS